MEIPIDSLLELPDRIPTAQPDEQLGSILERVESSYDAVLVFDSDKYVGVVSSYNALFDNRFPLTTKLSRAFFNPPTITADSTYYDIAGFMASTRLYTLPVLDGGKSVIGIVTARSLLQEVLKNKQLLSQIKDDIEIEKPFLSSIHTRVGEVYTQLRRNDNSTLIIVDEDEQVVGIATRRDLQQAFIAPSRRKRFGKNKGGIHFRSVSFDEEEIRRFDFPIGEFIKRDVIMLPQRSGIRAILQTMVENDVNSVILVNRDQKPMGVVSIQSFLKALSDAKPREKIQVKLSDKHKVISKIQERRILEIIGLYAKKIDTMSPVRFIEVSLDSYRNINGKTTGYEIHTRVHLQNGEGYMTKIEEKRLTTAVRNSFKKILSQEK